MQAVWVDPPRVFLSLFKSYFYQQPLSRPDRLMGYPQKYICTYLEQLCYLFLNQRFIAPLYITVIVSHEDQNYLYSFNVPPGSFNRMAILKNIDLIIIVISYQSFTYKNQSPIQNKLKYLDINVAIKRMTVKLFKSQILIDFDSCLLFIEPNP